MHKRFEKWKLNIFNLSAYVYNHLTFAKMQTGVIGKHTQSAIPIPQYGCDLKQFVSGYFNVTCLFIHDVRVILVPNNID